MKTPAPPQAPDYTAAAKATAAGDLDAAKFATKANRVNQTTPYGQIRYDYTPELDDKGQETGGGWSQTETLSPIAQQALDQELALNQKYGEVANIGFDKTRGIFENPGIDTAGLPALQGIDHSKLPGLMGINRDRMPKAPINAGQTAQDAIFSRLNPQLKQDDEAFRTRLANQGITLGSEAYKREADLMGQRSNDLRLQAAAQGVGLDMAARDQAFGEEQAFSADEMARRGQMFGEQQAQYGQSADQRGRMLEEKAYLQDRPLNLINALRTGNQVNAPQYQQFAQQATTQGPDILSATNAQYQAAVSANNAKNANKASMVGGLFGVGSGIAGLGVRGGGTVGGNFFA